jgi:hypothetical protein
MVVTKLYWRGLLKRSALPYVRSPNAPCHVPENPHVQACPRSRELSVIRLQGTITRYRYRHYYYNAAAQQLCAIPALWLLRRVRCACPALHLADPFCFLNSASVHSLTLQGCRHSVQKRYHRCLMNSRVVSQSSRHSDSCPSSFRRRCYAGWHGD